MEEEDDFFFFPLTRKQQKLQKRRRKKWPFLYWGRVIRRKFQSSDFFFFYRHTGRKKYARCYSWQFVRFPRLNFHFFLSRLDAGRNRWWSFLLSSKGNYWLRKFQRNWKRTMSHSDISAFWKKKKSERRSRPPPGKSLWRLRNSSLGQIEERCQRGLCSSITVASGVRSLLFYVLSLCLCQPAMLTMMIPLRHLLCFDHMRGLRERVTLPQICKDNEKKGCKNKFKTLFYIYGPVVVSGVHSCVEKNLWHLQRYETQDVTVFIA